MSSKDDVTVNSEILFIYEARLCNPNGDPDRENKPRIDPVTQRNYVTDVRLKRFLRDYIIEKVGEKYVWVTTIEGENVRADERFEKSDAKTPSEVSKYHIDARLFGATIPIDHKKGSKRDSSAQEEKVEAGSYQIEGPVQFAMGYSLHRVQLILETSTITSHFVGAEKTGKEKQYGTIGKDWRVYYSLIAFYGVVNAARGKRVDLKESDVKLLDNYLWEAVIKESITRSKIGHYPHLYLRIKYKDGETLVGDLRRYIKEDFEKDNIRDLADLSSLDFSGLFTLLGGRKESIDTVFFRVSEDFDKTFKIRENLQRLGIKQVELPHEGVKLAEETLVLK